MNCKGLIKVFVKIINWILLTTEQFVLFPRFLVVFLTCAYAMHRYEPHFSFLVVYIIFGAIAVVLDCWNIEKIFNQQHKKP